MRRSSILACLFATALSAASAPYSLDWHIISGGGGTTIGGTYSVCGTIGQWDARRSAGGNYAIDSGFWGRITAAQASGLPPLAIKLSGGEVTLSWPSAVGLVLQRNTDL